MPLNTPRIYVGDGGESEPAKAGPQGCDLRCSCTSQRESEQRTPPVRTSGPGERIRSIGEAPMSLCARDRVRHRGGGVTFGPLNTCRSSAPQWARVYQCSLKAPGPELPSRTLYLMRRGCVPPLPLMASRYFGLSMVCLSSGNSTREWVRHPTDRVADIEITWVSLVQVRW